MTRQSRALATMSLVLLTAPGPLLLSQERPVLELSSDDAVKRALENNADIAVEKYVPEGSAEAVRQAEGYYDTFFSGTLNRGKVASPPSSSLVGGLRVDTTTDTWNFGFTQPIPSGATATLLFNNNRVDTNSRFTNFNPAFNASLSLAVSQPLLRNLKIDSPREQLRLAKKNREISDVQFKQTVISTISSVKQAYYDLIYAIDNLAAAQKSLALARKLLNENQIRVKVGTMAPLDVVSAEAEVASREAAVIVADNGVASAEDALKTAIFPANDPATWALRIVPTDRPTAEPYPVDLEAAIRIALEKRTDVIAAQKNVELATISLQFQKNQELPGLDFVAGYGTAGIGGTAILRDPPFGGLPVATFPGGYGDALSDVFNAKYPTWRVGVNMTYAIQNRQNRAAAAQAQIAKDQAVAALRRLELQAAAEVRSAGRGVQTNFNLVASTRAARVLAAQRLDAEEKKFAAGMSTNFLVTQAQRDLAVAEVNELQAIAGYRKSLINFERTQEAGLSGTTSASLLFSGSLGGRGFTTAAIGAVAAQPSTTGGQ